MNNHQKKFYRFPKFDFAMYEAWLEIQRELAQEV